MGKFRKIALGVILSVALGAIFLLLVNAEWAYQQTYFYSFQSRDLSRALRLAAGQPIFYGPEMTGGGTLFGPFYYIVLLPWAWLSQGWEAAWCWMAMLSAGGAVAGWFYFRARFSLPAAILWIGLFSVAPVTVSVLLMFVNLSYMPLFTVVLMMGVCEIFLFARSSRHRGIVFCLSAFLIGLSMQLHFSIVAYMLALGLLQALAPRFSLPRVPAKAFMAGLFFFLLASLPHFAWMLLKKYGMEFGQPAPYTGQLSGAAPSILALMKGGTPEPFGAMLWRELAVINYVLPLSLPLIILTQLSASGARWSKAFLVLSVLSLAALLPYLVHFFAPQGSRYATPLSVALISLAVIGQYDLFADPGRLKRFNLAALSALLFFAGWRLFTAGYTAGFLWRAALGFAMPVVIWRILKLDRPAVALSVGLTIALGLFQRESYGAPGPYHHQRILPSAAQWGKIWGKIYSETGWEYEEAAQRVFYLFHQGEQEPAFGYQYGRKLVQRASPLPSPPDGYFVSMDKNVDWKDLRGWLLKQNFQKDIRDALALGEIELDVASAEFGPLVVGYRVKDGAKLIGKHFHNSPENYLPLEADLRLQRAPLGATKLAAGEAVFHWNECPGHHPSCSIGAFVSVHEEPGGRSEIEVKLVGSPLSQNSSWIRADWTLSWNRPFLRVECGGQKFRYELVSSVGFLSRYSVKYPTSNFDYGNHSMLAPYARTYHDCRGPVTSVAVGGESVTVDFVHGSYELPAGELTISF